jgi:hypothetical protein
MGCTERRTLNLTFIWKSTQSGFSAPFSFRYLIPSPSMSPPRDDIPLAPIAPQTTDLEHGLGTE